MSLPPLPLKGWPVCVKMFLLEAVLAPGAGAEGGAALQ